MRQMENHQGHKGHQEESRKGTHKRFLGALGGLGGGAVLRSAARWRSLAAAAGLLVLGTAIYANSCAAPFILDDKPQIAGDEAIQPPLSVRRLLAHNRPIVTASLALNCAAGRLDVRGYHLLNVAAHIACALLVYGWVRATLRLPALRARYGAANRWIAAITAALFLSHPIQTESVTYIIQRAEIFAAGAALAVLWIGAGARAGRRLLALALAGAFGLFSKETAVVVPALFALYDWCFIAAGRAGAMLQRWPIYLTLLLVTAAAIGVRGWQITYGGEQLGGLTLSSAAPPAVAAPLVAVPPEPNARESSGMLPRSHASRRRLEGWRLLSVSGKVFRIGKIPAHAEEAASSQRPSRSVPAGLDGPYLTAIAPEPTADGNQAVTPWRYLRWQFGVCVYYVRLILWPDRLCFDCGCLGPWPVRASILRDAVWLPALLLAALAAAAWWIRPRYPLATFCVLGAGLFLLPTSSIMPLMDVYVEHRLYLPIAFAALLGVAAVFDAGAVVVRRGWLSATGARTLGLAAAAAAIVTCGWLTVARNRLYAEPLRLWEDSVAQAPQSARVLFNLGNEYARRGQATEAVDCYQRLIRVEPAPTYYNNLGNQYLKLGRFTEAVGAFEQAQQLAPTWAIVQRNLSVSYARVGRLADSVSAAERGTQLEPLEPWGFKLLGDAYRRVGRADEARKAYDTARTLESWKR